MFEEMSRDLLKSQLMAKLGVGARPKCQFKSTTDSKHDLTIAENVLARNFTPPKSRSSLGRRYDLYSDHGRMAILVCNLDLFSRRVVGWSMAEHMCTELVLTALDAALEQCIPSQEGLVFHSDRGSQYASGDYRAALLKAEITCSMSRRANC
jgi:putative transposase